MLSKEVNRAVNTKSITQEELTKNLLEGYSAVEIAESLAEFILKSKETPSPITVTDEEYQRITSMFRVKGKRMVDGCYVAETRGRKSSNLTGK